MISAVARSAARSASTRKPATLASVMAALARALRVLHQPRLHRVQTTPSRRPVVPTFIVYDVLDVIGTDRGSR